MVEITFVTEGSELTVDAVEDTSVMWNAVQNSVPGIIGECGGELSCATCHVYLEPSAISRLPAPTLAETEMLEVLEAYTECSRLSCQIRVNETLKDMRFQVAPQE